MNAEPRQLYIVSGILGYDGYVPVEIYPDEESAHRRVAQLNAQRVPTPQPRDGFMKSGRPRYSSESYRAWRATEQARENAIEHSHLGDFGFDPVPAMFDFTTL